MTCQSHSRRNSLPPSIRVFAVADRPSDRPARLATRGFTLIEMLVSLAITLIMMGAVVTLFGVVSESVSKSRALVETSDRLRAAREIIQQDLQGATARLTPPLTPENDEGYFEIIEGPSSDGSISMSPYQYYSGLTPQVFTPALFGDCDDALMFTVRSRTGPFLGKYSPTSGTPRVIESPLAEVVYFLVQDGPIIDATMSPPMRLCTLYRRVLLVSPSLAHYNLPFADFYTFNDVSAHYATFTTPPNQRMVPNTLGDLTKRENRFAHYGDLTSTNYGYFPFLVHTGMLPQVPFAVVPTGASVPQAATYSSTVFPANRPSVGGFLVPLSGSRLGDDVLLTNVIAFDVRVWDPDAPLGDNSGIIVKPGDPGWNTGLTAVKRGAYVDLGYSHTQNVTPISQFSRINPNAIRSGLPVPRLAANQRIYDTWSLHYENDGIDNDGANGADLGTNGLDDNANGLIDEQLLNILNNGINDDSDGQIDEDDEYTGEYETLPPYGYPLRGVEITLRVYEPSSQQVREVVIVQNFDTK
jgi:prepilin-type N-terminal cleavage/methylation domain-containing protein